VTASDSVMPGVVSIPHGFGHDRDGVRLTVARDVRGPSVNDLTDPDRVEGVAGNAVLNGVPVTLRLVGTDDQDTSSSRVPSTSSERRVGSSTGGQMA
jgi:hypothetical protein